MADHKNGMAWGRIALVKTPAAQRDELAQQLGYCPTAVKVNELAEPLDSALSKALQAARKLPKPQKTNSSPKLPPLVLPVVVSNEQIKEPPKPVKQIKTTQSLPASKGSYQFPPAPKLAGFNKLAPLIYKTLALPTTANKVDVDALCQAIATAKQLQRLPKRQRQYWPHSLDVLIDNSPSQQCYWQDYYQLAEQLQQWLGTAAVRILRLSDDSYPYKSAQAALLLSSQPLKTIAYPIYEQYRRYSHKVQLSPALNTSDAKHIAWPLEPSKHLAKAHSELSAVELALTTLAPLVLVDTHLLRKLRTQLAWGSAGLEAAVWNHPSIEHVGMGVRLKPNLKADYEQQFLRLLANEKNGAYIAALDQIVTQHFADAYDGLRHLQRFSLDVLTQTKEPCQQAQTYMALLCSDAEGSSNPSLERQCETFCFAIPALAYKKESTEELAYNLACNAYQNSELPELMPQGFDPNKLPKQQGKTSEQDKAPQQWWLTLAGNGQIRLAPAPKTRPAPPYIATIDAKQNEPLRLIQQGQQQQRLINSAITLSLSDTLISLESSQQRLTLKGISKPTWAKEFGYKTAAVCYATIESRGKLKEAQLKQHSGAAYWLLPKPFGQDQYGVYQDLNIKGIKQRFRWIPPGEFLMGSPVHEVDRHNNEVQHTVTLSKGFWLADTTVTQALWQGVMKDTPSNFKGEKHPVDSVSWLQAQEFIQGINAEIQGLDASLPTEAQWEYACRAGTNMPFNWSNDRLDSDKANFNGGVPYADNPKSKYRKTTVAVDQFSPNIWGLYQMHGNVWEWCLDEWEEYLAAPNAQRQDLVIGTITGDEDAERVLRGGSWDRSGRRCRSASRRRFRTGARSRNVGFRLALGLEPQAGGASAEPLRSSDSAELTDKQANRLLKAFQEKPSTWPGLNNVKSRGKDRWRQ